MRESKYEPLRRHLEGVTIARWQTTFSEIEHILGFRLPESARAYPAWWANTHDNSPQKAAWRESGWRTEDLNLTAEHICFQRSLTRAPVSPLLTPNALSPTSIEVETNCQGNTTTLECRIKMMWVELGFMSLNQNGRLRLPTAHTLPAIYCFRIISNGPEIRYVGETDNIQRRLQNYRTPGPSQLTNTRLNERLIGSLMSGAEVLVSAILPAAAWIDWGEGFREADLSSKVTRCLFENAALLDLQGVEIESLNRAVRSISSTTP